MRQVTPAGECSRDFGRTSGLSAYVGVSLSTSRSQGGVFELMRSSQHRFDPREIAQVRAFAGIVAQAVDMDVERRASEQAIKRAVQTHLKMRMHHVQRLAVARH